MDTCVFCAIASRGQPAIVIHEPVLIHESVVIHESVEFICFLPLVQEVPGHTIIASKTHYQSLLDAPASVGSDLINVCKHLASHHRQSSNAVAFNLLNANGSAAQQSVMHLHFHFLPRHSNDGINAWPVLPGVA